MPKKIELLEVVNAVIQITFDALILYFFGVKSFLYLILGTLFKT